MTQYNTLNVKLSNLQLNKLKSGTKNGTEVIKNSTLNLSSYAIGNSNDEYNFTRKLLLTITLVSRLCKAFVNNWSADIRLFETQLDKIGQPGQFLSRLLGALLRIGLHLMKNVLKPLAKSNLILLGLSAAVSATDPATQKKNFGSGMSALIISNKEVDDIMKTTYLLNY